jgi:hypothetical protein
MLTFILIIISAILFLAWLVSWLQGSVWARLLAFVLFIPVVGFVAAASVLPPGSAILMEPNGWLAFLIGIPVAWLVAGLPTYLRSSG